MIRRLIARDIADENSAESAVALVMAERLVKSDFWKIRAESLEIITHSAIKRNRRNEGGDRKSERFRSQTEVPLLRLNATMTTISKPTGKKELKTELTVPITSSRHLPYEKILIGFTTDLEPRVRAKAVELLLLTIESGLDVTVGSYDSLCPLLQDDDDVVRRLTAKLIWRFARLFPEDCVKGPHDGVELRLLDDAFGKLCGCMHDTSVEVRKDSAEYLGSLDNVSQKFLEQTLDKKLMPKMRLMRAGAQRTGREGVPVYSDFATGRVFGADAPAEKVEEDSASLIPSGSCGAFITGLEDEYTGDYFCACTHLLCMVDLFFFFLI